MDVADSHMPSLFCGDSFLSDSILNVSVLSEGASTSTSKSQPNILKKRDVTFQGPIRNLPFSPSRFLNQNKISDASSCKIGGTQEESLCINTTEDSGIEISAYDIDSLFSNPITSTPKIKKQETAMSVENSFEEVSRLSESCLFSGPDSVLSENQGNCTSERVIFRSPLIRRFINESGPRTPTPFKFRFGKNSFSKTIEECSDVDSTEPRNRISYRRLKCGPSTANSTSYRRKARKALNMDGSYKDVSSEYLYTKIKHTEVRPSLYRNHLCGNSLSGWRNGSFYTSINGSAMKYSNLIDSSYEMSNYHVPGISSSVQEDHEFAKPQRPPVSVACSQGVNHLAYMTEMNEKLVRVACGGSDDQKAMTLAAKRYLRLEKKAQSSESTGKMPHGPRLSHRMLC